MDPIIAAIIAFIIGAGISGFILFKVGINYRKQQAETAIGSAEKEAERKAKEAEKAAEKAAAEAANAKDND